MSSGVADGFQGKVYDVTDFLDVRESHAVVWVCMLTWQEHPGGAEIILYV